MTIYKAFQLLGFSGALLLSVQLYAATAPYPPEYYKHYSKENPLFPLDKVETPPTPVQQDSIQLPEELVKLHVKAAIAVEFVISKSGDVEYPTVLKSTEPRFNDVTLVTVRKWKFKPALKNGKPVNCRVAQQLTFN